MAKCDICGKTASILEMESLRDCYQSEGVKDVCRECSKWADDQLWKIRDENATELKRRIAVRVNRPKRLLLWRRIFMSNNIISDSHENLR